MLFFGGTSYFHLKSKPLVDYVVLGPVTPLQILPTNEPDDLYTIQNNNLKFAAKLAFSISPTSSAQPALPENPGRAGWAELVGEIEQAHLAVTLDFYSVWYRDHLIH